MKKDASRGKNENTKITVTEKGNNQAKLMDNNYLPTFFVVYLLPLMKFFFLFFFVIIFKLPTINQLKTTYDTHKKYNMPKNLNFQK